MTHSEPVLLVRELLAGREPRILLEVPLCPVMGSRFQPTGFPDLGAAEFPDPEGKGRRLLVESPQSMANRLESVCWDGGANELAEPLRGLPYVQVSGLGTNSILEAHRLNSPYVLADEPFKKAFTEAAGLGQGTVDRSRFAAALLRYDPNSVVHGAFMSLVGSGTGRLERMLSAFIEAEDAQPAEYGGVKVDRNDTSGKDSGGSAEGFGNVPYHRRDYVARRIAAWFSLDLAGLRGLRLPAPGAELVGVLALWKVRAFLDGSMRLRTACELEVGAEESWRTRPAGFRLPSMEVLDSAVREAIDACAQAELFASPVITEVTYASKKEKGEDGKTTRAGRGKKQ